MSKDPGAFRELRELARVHGMVVRDVGRVQRRLKSLYRSRGIQVVGKTVYGSKGRAQVLPQLPSGTRAAAETLSAAYDALVEVHDRAQTELLEESQ